MVDERSEDQPADEPSAAELEAAGQSALFGAADGKNAAKAKAPAYQVLARKYRPQAFDDLIGQDILVRTLTNAFRMGRVSHAFMLTGVRGVGKTTTARIIAKGLNCIGEDGLGGPTVSPCGVCANCRDIAASSHVDVFEMDAASRTGIDDIREIIDATQYLPIQGRTKVYIIDEVHMLSRAAFNGLLKTLEEPPAHVKFIFATTEIRKVPVTVLSRCQRFDLRRVEAGELIAHLARIAAEEGAEVEEEGLAMIVRAAEGSVRDALSLLDQAIARGRDGPAGEAGPVRAATVRDMLGLADGGRMVDLLEALFTGDAAGALRIADEQARIGAEPLVVLTDLLNLVHALTRAKILGAEGLEVDLAETRERLSQLGERLPMAGLARSWQMLQKGVREVREAAQPQKAAEMVLMRLAYAADLPLPDQVLRSLTRTPTPPGEGATQGVAANDTPAGPAAAPPGAPRIESNGGARGGPQALAVAPRPQLSLAPDVEDRAPEETVDSLGAVAALAGQHRDIRLKTEIEDFVGLVYLEPGRLDFVPAPGAPEDLAGRLSEGLGKWTSRRWVVSVVSDQPAEPTLSSVRKAREDAVLAEVSAHPLVIEAMARFPGARIAQIRDLAESALAEIGAGLAAAGESGEDDDEA